MFYIHPSFQHHARPKGKMKLEFRNEKKIYLSISILSPTDPVAITDIFTHKLRKKMNLV